MPTKLTPEIINAAIGGFEQQKLHIDTQIAELRAMLPGGPATSASPEPKKRKRRKMSAAGRKAIAEAQRKRWAVSKKSVVPSAPATSKPKRKLRKHGRPHWWRIWRKHERPGHRSVRKLRKRNRRQTRKPLPKKRPPKKRR